MLAEVADARFSVSFRGICVRAIRMAGRGRRAHRCATAILMAQIQPLLKKHCFACHSGEEPKGESRLDLLKFDFADSETRDAWQAVARRVEAGEMPPKGKPGPAAKEVTALARGLASRREPWNWRGASGKVASCCGA